MRRRRRILLVGSGDIALRAAQLLKHNYRLLGTARRPDRHAPLRTAGITPLFADLDRRRGLRRLGGMSPVVLHLAPPQEQGETDTRTRHLLAALSQGARPTHFVYISTSGVYGDCGSAHVAETRPPHPATARAQRRTDAERQIRTWAARNGVRACILRVPGIYAANRLPLERLRAGTPAILPGEDSHTNHIHADDLARAVVAALRFGAANRIYHASDDSDMKMGDYFDAVADACGLPPPPRLPRAQVQAAVSAALWSFMNESRRLDNTRMKRELKVRLRYPTVKDGLRAATAPARK
jgi:nucleoside-diphosphate-sugar epimerase